MNIGKGFNRHNPVGLGIILGCGMGYQVKEFLANYDVQNLIVYDRIEDGLYASLHIIDWEEVATEIHRKRVSSSSLPVKIMTTVIKRYVGLTII